MNDKISENLRKYNDGHISVSIVGDEFDAGYEISDKIKALWREESEKV